MDPQPRLHPQSPGAETARAGHTSAVRAAGPAPAFAHASEAELGRILDFYGVTWEYEPRTFPLMWTLDGHVTESFTPDFYLPELDLFLELTTLRQKLVRKKNRKLRRLREVYPEVRIKLLYAKDFRALMLKFGRIGLADAFSGAVGQTTPPRGGRAAHASTPPGSAGGGDASPARAARRPSVRRRVAASAASDASGAAAVTAVVTAVDADRPATAVSASDADRAATAVSASDADRAATAPSDETRLDGAPRRGRRARHADA